MKNTRGLHPFGGEKLPASLHLLKDKCDSRERLGQDIEALLSHLPDCLAETSKRVHRRSSKQVRADLLGDRTRLTPTEMGYSKARTNHRAPTRERQLEAAMWRRWGTNAPMKERASALWSELMHWQLPLFDRKHKEHWGHVDLLGVSRENEPLVIELKIADSKNSPLHAVLEGCAYAIALRDNWSTYHAEMESLGLSHGLRPSAKRFPVAVVAETLYWNEWAPSGRLGDDVPNLAWDGFRELLKKLEASDLPVLFGRVDGETVGSHVFAPESLRFETTQYP